MANDLGEALIQAMKKMNEMSTAASTDVIQAEVVELKSADSNTYIIKYQDIEMDALASIGNTYQPKDKVYVLVPGHNFAMDKIIISNIPNTLSDEDTYFDENASDYITIVDNLLSTSDIFNLCSYKASETEVGFGDIKSLMKEYLSNKKMSNFALKVNVQTNLDSSQMARGNYGVKIYFPFVKLNANKEPTEYTEKEFILDTQQMDGNPYRYFDITTQEFNFTLVETDGEKYDYDRNPRIVYFSDDKFNQDPKGDHPYDIYLTNLKLSISRKLTEDEKKKTNLVIRSDTGYVFLPSDFTLFHSLLYN